MHPFVSRSALVLLAVFGGYRAWLALRSPEDVIRELVLDAAEGFNDSRLAPCMALLAPDFVDETSGFHRDDVKAVLVHVFFSELDPVTKELRLRLTIEDVEVAVLGSTATANFTARLAERVDGTWGDVWTFRLEGELLDGAEGFRLERARFRTLTGDIPD